MRSALSTSDQVRPRRRSIHPALGVGHLCAFLQRSRKPRAGTIAPRYCRDRIIFTMLAAAFAFAVLASSAMTSALSIARESTPVLQELRSSVETALEGKPDAVELALIALLGRGHVLIEDVPGVGKTTLARALSKAVGGEL